MGEVRREEMGVSEGPVVLSRSRGSIRNATSSEEVVLDFYDGLFVDVLDTLGYWSEAQVVEVDLIARRVLVTYLYWSDRWDEWIEVESVGVDRFAPYRSRAYQGDGRFRVNQRVEILDDEGVEWMEGVVVSVEQRGETVRVRRGGTGDLVVLDAETATKRVRPFGRHKRVVKKREGMSREGDRGRAPIVGEYSGAYRLYVECLAGHGLQVVHMEGDGNCLFRSVSHQVYGDARYHRLVRVKCMEYMEVEKEYFEPYVEGTMEDFLQYLQVKRRDGVWGDDPEVQALCELYNRPTEIWAYSSTHGAHKLRTFHEAAGDAATVPMRLSYYGGGHYDSVVPMGAHFSPINQEVEPGQMEDEMIAYARRRGTQREGSIGTNGAMMEAALKASREEFEANQQDMETALLASMEEYEKRSMESVIQQSLQDDTGVEEDIVQQAIAESLIDSGTTGGGGGRGRGSVEDEEIEIARAMEESMKEATEEEILKKVMEESVRMHEEGQQQEIDNDIELAVALEQSLRDQRRLK